MWKNPGEVLSGRLIEPTLKFGRVSLMMWGCFTWDGVVYTFKIDGKMDVDLYCHILKYNMQKTMEYYGLEAENVTLCRTMTPTTHQKAKQWFQGYAIPLLSLTAQLPDLNPVEWLWSILKRRLAEYEEAPAGVLAH